jgi:hypothetical protein
MMNMSLYIPVISNSTEEFIKLMFLRHKIGKVSRVDYVQNLEKHRKEAFVHFEEWFVTPEAILMQTEIMDPNIKARFKYCESGKYWPLLVNKNATTQVYNPKYKNIDSKIMKADYKSVLLRNCHTSHNTKTESVKKQHILLAA